MVGTVARVRGEIIVRIWNRTINNMMMYMYVLFYEDECESQAGGG